MTTNTDPHEALAQHERDMKLLSTAADDAYAALLAAAGDPCRLDELPQRRTDRDRARRAVIEAEGKLPALRAAVSQAEARQRAEEQRARAEAEAEARRVAEAARREQLAAELAPHLAILESATIAARQINDEIATAETDRKPIDGGAIVSAILEHRDRTLEVLRVRGAVAGEAVEVAAKAVADVDPRHPAVYAVRGMAKALGVHGTLGDAEEIRTLGAAARSILRALLDRAARHPTPRLALAQVMLDASAEEPLLGVVGGAPASMWAGLVASRKDALVLAAHHANVQPSAHLSVEEIGALVLGGRSDEAWPLITKREHVAEQARLIAATDRTGSWTAAVEEYKHGDRTPERVARIRAIVGAVAQHMATQILGQMGRYPLGPFSVVMPGASMPETLDDLSRLLPAVAAHDVNGRPIGTHPSSIGRRTPPGSPREQLIAHLGLENLPELHDVVPSLDAADSKPTAPRGAFTAFAPEASA